MTFVARCRVRVTAGCGRPSIVETTAIRCNGARISVRLWDVFR